MDDTHRGAVLLVDDNPIICQSLAFMLEDEGFTHIFQAFTAEDALALVQEHRLELAFMDVRLKDANGLELAKDIREICPQLDIVFMSGAGSRAELLEAVQIGAVDYLLKPFSPELLSLTLDRFTKRRALTRRVHAAEHRLGEILKNIPLLVFQLDKNFQLRFINDACKHVLGESVPTTPDASDWFMQHVHPEERERISELLRTALHSETPRTAECRLIHHNGAEVYGYIKTLPALPSELNGQEPLVDGIFIDISERVNQERSTVQQEKLKTVDAISSEMAHELRNPLMTIGGFARRLLLRFPDLHEAQIILRESERLEHLLDRIKSYLQKEQAENLQKVSVRDVLERSIHNRILQLEGAGLTLDIAHAPDLPSAIADPQGLQHVLEIMLGDASQSLMDAGTLVIRTQGTQDRVDLTFSYALEDLRHISPERLYLPFDEGGFGLPQCTTLIRGMCGVMRMERKEGNVVFTISLPAETEKKHAEPTT